MLKNRLLLFLVCILLAPALAGAETAERTAVLPADANKRADYVYLMGDKSVTQILVAEGNGAFTSREGVLYTIDGKELLLYPTGRGDETYAVPEGTERIDDECTFNYGCQLKTLFLPASLRSFCEVNLFRTVIENYFVDPENPVFCDVDGVLFSKDRKTLVAYPPGRQADNFTVPDGTEAIGPGAFCENEYVKNVILPDSVQTIGDYTFSGSRIESIRLPEHMKAIGTGAFDECYDLAGIRLPDGLTEIPDNMLRSCINLKGTLRIPEGVTFVGIEALFQLLNITDIYWPDSLACLVSEQSTQEWDGELIDLVYGWNDQGLADSVAVMHAHEGTQAAEWIMDYPHIITPKGTDSMDMEGCMAACMEAMRKAGRTDAMICFNPEIEWFSVIKPLIAYQPHRAVAVFRQGDRTLLCGFDDSNGEWKLRWVNETFLNDGHMPMKIVFSSEDELEILLPDADNTDNAVDYGFGADTLVLRYAIHMPDYLWDTMWEDPADWHCVSEGDRLIYSESDIYEWYRTRSIDAADVSWSVTVDRSQLYLPEMDRVPVPPETADE